MKKFLLITFLTLCISLVSYGEQSTFATFKILEAKIDGVDYTDWYIQNGCYTVFYISEPGNFCMANVCPKENTQSYGTISMWEEKVYPETEGSWEMNVFTFRWSYQNSYDSKTGSAMCRLVKIYKPTAVAYELILVLENMSTLELKGYMEGSIKNLF